MTPPAATPTLEPGYRLDRYELLCKIGQGGMATVWLARTTNSHGDERLVAIKTILAGAGADETLRAMLLDEARIVKSIDHPNVACTLEVGQLWDMPYLVLEYVEGDPVDQLCKTLAEDGLAVPSSIVARIIADAAAGLHAAHEVTGPDGENLGIVHRDVSPPNIMVDDLGQARVIDFGVAKATERFAPQTEAGVMKGRVPYMSPEHASGGAVDRRSDIWSLGVVAYFMLSGRYPFAGANDAARLIKILGTEPADPLPQHVPEAMQMVVMKALSKDPDLRWQTADELRAAMKAAVRPTSHEEVAKFCAETLAGPQRARHALLDHALAAAAQRERARQLLDGPVQAGKSRSVRPPAVALIEEDEGGTSAGTLGRPVTVSQPGRPAQKSWLVWGAAGAVAFVVIVAFVLGTMSGTNSANAKGTAPDPSKSASGVAGAGAGGAESPTSTGVPTTTIAARPSASASASASSKTAPSAPSATTKAPPGPIYTWPPPKPSASAAPKPPLTKPPEREDTIF